MVKMQVVKARDPSSLRCSGRQCSCHSEAGFMAEESGVGLGANPGPSLTLRTTPGFVILRAVSRPKDLGKGFLKAKTDSPPAMLGATENQVLRVA